MRKRHYLNDIRTHWIFILFDREVEKGYNLMVNENKTVSMAKKTIQKMEYMNHKKWILL
ncbi:unnamed protein product [Paramecium octaurelia]|uniref:Uncharacterized protein n=1 Tax=Paramecium octaurelia TaxID=43137 RepID=A0A8S1W8Z8_PAROT|nr:unnamed protein product [Paramecium octaurelia]